MSKKHTTTNGVVRTAVPGAIRLALRKLSSLTGSVASEGWSSSEDIANFCRLVEAILYDWKEPADVQEEENIFPTPESESEA